MRSMSLRSTRAQIVGTIGPASWSPERVRDMIDHGLDAIRLNFSWGSYDEHAHYIKTARSAGSLFGREIPVIQDLSGPREQGAHGHEYDADKEILTEKDLRDLAFGVSQKVDYVAMSYVGAPSDIALLRSEMSKLGLLIPVIAKIERRIAVENLKDIVAAADAVMVARGDLGNEVPLEEIPYIEKDIIAAGKAAGKPVITATQMMLSMKDHDTPTRAEITDVVYAIEQGSDAVMLSEETALGLYPVHVIDFMDRAIAAAESRTPVGPLHPLTCLR